MVSEDAFCARLEVRTHHHSLKEMRETPRSALARDADVVEEPILQLATRLFGPERGVDLHLPPRTDDGQRPVPDFSGPEQGR